jgi:pilus assembly protein CpaE
VPASTILILDQDPVAADVIKSALTGAGYQATVVDNPDEVFRVAADFHMLIVDVVTGRRTAEDITRDIRATEALAAVPVMCVAQSDDVEDRVRLLEAGADDVMAKPFDARELEARVEALLLRFQRSHELTPTVTPLGGLHRAVLLFFSPKGGVGTTTIAVNVALALTQRLGADRVVIIDLDLQWGQVATHLNLRPAMSVAELVQDEAALGDPEGMRSYATRHDSGLNVIAAPLAPDQFAAVQPSHIGRVLATARDAYEAVVVDGGSALDDRTRVLLGEAEQIVLPLYPEIAALKALHSLLDNVNETGGVSGTMTFVLNHLFAREMLKVRDIENTLAARVAVELPHDPIVYLKAVNEGVPLVLGAPQSQAAERLLSLTSTLSGDSATDKVAEAPRRKGLFGSLARRT